MSTILWGLVLLAAVWAAHWGAEHLSNPLRKVRKQWGFSVTAGGALVGLTAASPEIGINIASAARGVSEIGLGTMLGSNVIAIPLMVTTAYLATRNLKGEQADKGHGRHKKEHLLKTERSAVTVQAIPYIVIVGIFAVLTLPSGWRGLQPVDGWVMLGVYIIYLIQALLRDQKKRQNVSWKQKEVFLALAGLAALAAGAFFTVRATEQIVSTLGISRMVGGLFITATMAALPEVFATWSVAKSGQITSSVTSVIGDHATTMTIALLPLALVTVPVQNFILFVIVLAFVGLMGILYGLFIHLGSSREPHGFNRWHVCSLLVVLVIYIFVIIITL